MTAEEMMPVQKVQKCPQCLGLGQRNGKQCSRCNGSGEVDAPAKSGNSN
jgi:DnaJ-class molecular chaperone